MNTEQVAQKVVELVRKQAWHEALDTLYDKNIVIHKYVDWRRR
jgi:hypothetical protein